MSVADPVSPEYLWLVVCCALASFFLGLGVGANDVGNSFATVVGSKTLSLRTAIFLAIVFETLGCMVLGRTITGTIQGGIADINAFVREPAVFAYGMLCTAFTTGVWQLLAQYWEINVSSGQSLIGSIIGFALVYDGADAVLWNVKDPKSWPPYKGMVSIIITWFFSPVFTAIAAAILFWIVRTAVLRRKRAAMLAFWVLPFAVLITAFVCIYFLLSKGAKKYIVENNPDWTDADNAWVAAAAAGGLAVISAVAVIPLLKWMTNKHFSNDGVVAEGEAPAESTKEGVQRTGSSGSGSSDPEAGAPAKGLQKQMTDVNGRPVEEDYTGMPWWKMSAKRFWYLCTYGTSVDVHAIVKTDPIVAEVHANTELFDPRAEHVFTYLQVFSAICVMFAHGAGEVGYMAGPINTCWMVYTEGKIVKSAEVPVWTLVIGTVSMLAGLLFIGYKMIIAMGVRMTRLSASRGFCAELATALVVLIGSQWGLPIAGSQVIVGGVLGVGLLEKNIKAVNWRYMLKTLLFWIITIFAMGISTAALFAQGIYAPGKIEGGQQIQYEDALAAASSSMADSYRAALESYRPALQAGAAIPRLDVKTIDAWSADLKKMSADLKNIPSGKTQTVYADQMVAYLTKALSLYQYDTVLSVGQVQVFPGALECNSNNATSIAGNAPAACMAPSLLPKGVAATWPPK